MDYNLTVECKIAIAKKCRNELKSCPHSAPHFHRESCDIIVPDKGNCHGAVCIPVLTATLAKVQQGGKP